MKTNKVLKYALSIGMLISLSTPIHATNQGWISNNGTWKYTNQDGSLSKGWKLIDGVWYVFNADGSMKTGWVASDEKWYFLGGSGVMQANKWINLNGVNYYIKSNGIMATDFIRDGFELDSTGKAVLIEQTKSVEYTQGMDLQNQTIEGNLYIDAAKFRELELNGITVNGKVVIIGSNVNESLITIKDSNINIISTQARNAEIVLSGKTTVDTVVMEENTRIKPDKSYKGKIALVDIQSTVKNEIQVDLPTKTVLTNTFAPISINAPVDNLAIGKKTELKVNAAVDNITVNKTATDTKVTVEKDVNVGNILSDTKVEVTGNGTVENVKGDEVTNNIPEVEKPSAGGGGSAGGGSGSGGNTGGGSSDGGNTGTGDSGSNDGGNTGGDSGAAGGNNNPEAVNKVAKAISVAEAAIKNMTVSNEATQEYILNIVNEAIDNANLTCVKAVWYEKPIWTAASEGVTGHIKGQIDIFASPGTGDVCDTSAQMARSIKIELVIPALQVPEIDNTGTSEDNNPVNQETSL